MKRLKVRISADAKLQIREQVLHIARHSVDNALAWEDRVSDAINRLGDLLVHAVDEDASRRMGQTVHKLAFEKTYLIHYQINESAGIVEIMNFRHGARLPKVGEP